MPDPAARRDSSRSARGATAIIRGGTVIDGLGGPPYEADIVVAGDRIAAVEPSSPAVGDLEIDARGLAVAPGFINMLSWATESLLVDGRAVSDLVQGVTLEVFGEGVSMGPLTPAMRERMIAEQGVLRYDVTWDSLGGFLETLERRGVSPNVASYIGATTVRMHELGEADRAPDVAELRRMQALVERGMHEGATGVASALIYAPACFAEPAELQALASVAARHGGAYASHLRSEGDRLIDGLAELLELARRTHVRVELYHLKALGPEAPELFVRALAAIQEAQAAGLQVTADMYPYAAASTGLDAAMPPWAQEGGNDAWIARLRDPATRRIVVEQMRLPAQGWDNHLRLAGTADRVVLAGFRQPHLAPLAGLTLGEIARRRGLSPEEAAIDLVIEDGGRVDAIYHNQAEAVVDRVVGLPWVSFGSDAGSYATEPPFTALHPHPRAYGTFARVLGHYVRERGLAPLEEAVRRMTSLPAATLGIRNRGRLQAGCAADIVVFDPGAVAARATYAMPHAYAVGVRHVLVNGAATVLDGRHTGMRAGRVVRGPGWSPSPA